MSTTRLPAKQAFTAVELFIVAAVMCVLGALFLPALNRPHRSPRINCTNNLKQIGLAFKTWSLDNNDKFPMQVSVTNGGTMELVESGSVWVHFLVMSNELSTPKVLICPQETDSNRVAASTFSHTIRNSWPNSVPFTNDNNVSYFVGVDAQDIYPQMLLAGDKNIAIDGRPAKRGLNSIWTNSIVAWRNPQHDGCGNVGLADGSVQGSAGKALTSYFRTTGVATNRLSLP